MNKQRYFAQKRILAVYCLCLITIIVSGCAPLRKKFTRKKKTEEKSERFVPVLDPIDYEVRTQTPLEKYKYHYSLWKVWEKDLVQTIERDGSEKRQKYLFDQIIVHLTEMENLLIEEKRAELLVLIQELQELKKIYEKSSVMRRMNSVVRQLTRNASKVRNNFSPTPSLVGMVE